LRSPPIVETTLGANVLKTRKMTRLQEYSSGYTPIVSAYG
jgi:hypothetical protein